MFNKKALTLAVAAATAGLSFSAAAAINVTTGAGKVAIANESVTPTTTGTLPVGVGAAGTALDIAGQLGVGVANNDQIFIRFDWTGAELINDLSTGSIDVSGVGSTSLSDGLAGDSSAIFGVTAGTSGFSQTAGVALTIGTSGLGLTGASTSVRMRVYETQTNAINETLDLSDQSVSGAITLGDALSVSFASETATAEVTENFLKFTGPSNTGTMGSFTASASTSFTLANTLVSVAALTDLVTLGTSSVVTYTGDFSFATDVGAYYVSGTTDGTCSTTGSTVVTVDTSSLSSATTTVAAANGRALCVQVDGTSQTIPEATYDAAVTLVHATTTSVPSSTSDSGTVGVIDRNGTTVEVAYLTTFSDYNQRLLINSRHPVAAQYNVTFRTENGVTATPLAKASGTLQPGENLVLKATDLVTLTGGTRCSATVTVVAPSGNISVATTQVNLSDASTDTVSYN